MSLTPQQITQARAQVGIPANGYGAPTANPQDTQAKLAALPWYKAPVAPTPQLGNDAIGIGQYAGNAIKDQAVSGAKQVAQGFQDAKIATNPLQETEAGMKELAGGIGAVTAPLAPAIKPVMDAANWLGKQIGSTKVAQDLVMKYPQLADTISRIATDTGNTATVLGTAMGGVETIKGLPETAARVSSATTHIVDTVKSGVDTTRSAMTPEPPPPGAAEATAKADAAAKLQPIAEKWREPATMKGTAAYNKARAVLEKDPATPDFLAEQHINPYAHVDKSGNFATQDTAEALRETAGKMSNEVLRPSLQMADYSTPKTSTADIISEAKKYSAQDKTITPDDAEAIASLIEQKGAALARKNPDGMSLTNMHDNKITYAENGGYNALKSNADNNGAIANRAIAGALQKIVEDKAPPSVPAGELNEYFQKYYRAADYLDALNTKKAPVSVMQNIAHRAAQGIGAVAAHAIGGGVLLDVAGYGIGGALEHALEHLTGQARASFLSNLEVTQPKVFSQVQDYLRRQGSGDTGMLRLPPGTPGDSPIPMGPGPDTSGPVAGQSSVAPYAAKAKLPAANPKTGRMTRVYTQAPSPK